MIFGLVLTVFAAAVSAQRGYRRQISNSTVIPSSVFATFPAYGPAKNISGTIELRNKNASGVEIIIGGLTALTGFPADLGPFAWHSAAPHTFVC